MIRLFCRSLGHAGAPQCDDCAKLSAYAERRLECCPFGEGKMPCSECPVHCYAPSMRSRIREVMRYAGWRMMFRHPLLALWHQVDVWRSRRPTKAQVSQQAESNVAVRQE